MSENICPICGRWIRLDGECGCSERPDLEALNDEHDYGGDDALEEYEDETGCVAQLHEAEREIMRLQKNLNEAMQRSEGWKKNYNSIVIRTTLTEPEKGIVNNAKTVANGTSPFEHVSRVELHMILDIIARRTTGGVS